MRKHLKISAFGDAAVAKMQATCYHEWEPLHAYVLEYIEVDAQCVRCGTFWRAKNALDEYRRGLTRSS